MWINVKSFLFAIWSYKTVRWIAVLPVAISGLFLASLLSKFLSAVEMNYLMIEENSIAYFFTVYVQNPIINGLFSMGAFVYFGSSVAPTHKKTTSVVLAVIAFLFTIISMYLINFVTLKYLDNIAQIGSFIGILIGYFYSKDKYENE